MTSIQDIYDEYEEFAYVGQKFITCDDYTIELIGEISKEKFYENKDFDLITTCGDKIFKCVFDDMEGSNSSRFLFIIFIVL
jgi:hypothetical protein